MASPTEGARDNHRAMAFGWFCGAQGAAVITGVFQIGHPHRPFALFLVALGGSIAVPVIAAVLHLRTARRLAPLRTGYPGLDPHYEMPPPRG